MPVISFATANYAGRALRYDEQASVAEHVTATMESTTIEVLDEILADIKGQGFDTVDLWMCHCDWQKHADDDFAERVRERLDAAGLALAAYAGGASLSTPEELDRLFGFVKRLGAPILSGIIWDLPDAPETVQVTCERHDLRWSRENHDERSAAEMLAQIGNGKFDRCGVTLDTGWCLRQEIKPLDAAKAVREHLLVLHLKDKRAGEDATCVLGEGSVPAEKIVRYLIESDWDGVISIEQEPMYCNPSPKAAASLARLREWLKE